MEMESRCKYALYGSVRMIKDFLYIFHELEIVLLVPRRQAELLPKEYRGVKKGDIKEINSSGAEKVILCQRPSLEREETLARLINKLAIPVIPCEDFFAVYDEPITIPEGHELYVWGTGRMAKHLIATGKMPQQVVAFIDSYRDGATFKGRPLLRPQDLTEEEWGRAFVVVAVDSNKPIISELEKHGLSSGIDFIDYRKISSNPAQMLRDTFFSEDGYDFACDTMLNHLEVLRGGATRVCCTTFMRYSRTNFLERNFMEYWYGSKDIFHRVLALSTQNRTYVYCDKAMCPLFDGRRNLGAEASEVAAAEYHEITPKPEVVALGFDKSCNLACETCRKEVEMVQGEEKVLVDSIADKVTRELLPYAKFAIMAGNGEVLFSPAYRKVWASPAAGQLRYFRLLSNGTLFNEKNWEAFVHGKEHTKIMLTVSIDAASQEMYESIRRLGNFTQLQKNMAFAGRLRREGKLAYFRMNFVVQKKNLGEMESFAKWGQEIGADKVFFTKILNWGTYSDENYERNISVMESDGVTPKHELKKILGSPALRNPIVDLGTIRYTHQPNTDDYVHNYYMWELEKDVQGIF